MTAATRTSPPPLGVPTAPPLPADLEALARRLRLPHLRRCAPEIIATAKAQRWDPTEVLESRPRRRSRWTGTFPPWPPGGPIWCAAGFPTGKTFHAWNETASSIPAPTQAALRTLEWVHRRGEPRRLRPVGDRQDVLPRGVGLGMRDPGLKVAWFTLEDLGNADPGATEPDDTMSKAIGRILRADLVVVDDIGLLPVAPDAAEGLYRLVDAAYEKRSIGISSNLHPGSFDESMPKTLATRHRRPVAAPRPRTAKTNGDSVRLTQQRPTRRGTCREGDPTDLTTTPAGWHTHWADLMAITGQNPRPSTGTSTDRPRADPNVP